jgi:hypothetical protein
VSELLRAQRKVEELTGEITRQDAALSALRGQLRETQTQLAEAEETRTAAQAEATRQTNLRRALQAYVDILEQRDGA